MPRIADMIADRIYENSHAKQLLKYPLKHEIIVQNKLFGEPESSKTTNNLQDTGAVESLAKAAVARNVEINSMFGNIEYTGISDEEEKKLADRLVALQTAVVLQKLCMLVIMDNLANYLDNQPTLKVKCNYMSLKALTRGVSIHLTDLETNSNYVLKIMLGKKVAQQTKRELKNLTDMDIPTEKSVLDNVKAATVYFVVCDKEARTLGEYIETTISGLASRVTKELTDVLTADRKRG